MPSASCCVVIVLLSAPPNFSGSSLQRDMYIIAAVPTITENRDDAPMIALRMHARERESAAIFNESETLARDDALSPQLLCIIQVRRWLQFSKLDRRTLFLKFTRARRLLARSDRYNRSERRRIRVRGSLVSGKKTSSFHAILRRKERSQTGGAASRTNQSLGSPRRPARAARTSERAFYLVVVVVLLYGEVAILSNFYFVHSIYSEED